jgi:hypothetical protein
MLQVTVTYGAMGQFTAQHIAGEPCRTAVSVSEYWYEFA